MVENKKQINVSSTSEGLNQLEAFIEDICYEYNIMNTWYSNIQLALNEVFINAKVHGNKNNPNASIGISFYSDSKGLHFIVQDEGKGFDYQHYIAINAEDLPEEGNNDSDARGIIVIKMLADEVHFLNEGNTIELIFYISSINYSLTLERSKHLQNYFSKIVLYKSPS